MRTVMTVIVAIWLVGISQMMAHANTMNGTGVVKNLTQNTIKINGNTYSLHKNVHVGIYQHYGSKDVEETRSLKSIEPGQEVRYKTYGNMVLELIILKR